MFAPDFRRLTYARADLLSHRFSRLREEAGLPDAALHRFRHSVATHLVADGKLLKAQARLGHRDPATTLRHYAHATPLDDLDVADEIDQRLNDCLDAGRNGAPPAGADTDRSSGTSAVQVLRRLARGRGRRDRSSADALSESVWLDGDSREGDARLAQRGD